MLKTLAQEVVIAVAWNPMVKFLLPLFALALLLMGCTPKTTTTTETYGTGSVVTSSSTSSAAMSAAANSSDASLLSGKHTVVLKTSKGDITLELDADRAPMAVTNFVTHAQEGYYDDLIFHRVISGFMIQGGDPQGTGRGGESIFGETFKDEIVSPMEYKRGVIAMANRGPNTNGSQFFIMHKDYPLPPNYTIFGQVTSGLDVVDAIATAKTDANDRPLEPITFSAVAQEKKL